MSSYSCSSTPRIGACRNFLRCVVLKRSSRRFKNVIMLRVQQGCAKRYEAGSHSAKCTSARSKHGRYVGIEQHADDVAAAQCFAQKLAGMCSKSGRMFCRLHVADCNLTLCRNAAARTPQPDRQTAGMRFVASACTLVHCTHQKVCRCLQHAESFNVCMHS